MWPEDVSVDERAVGLESGVWLRKNTIIRSEMSSVHDFKQAEHN